MERINHILNNPQYRTHLKRTARLEKKRIFCRHGLQHALDVARIAYIFVLEQKLDVAKDVVYAAALLHDIGKWDQLEHGTPHHLSSAALADGLLDEAAYLAEEKSIILQAITNHRTKGLPEGTFDAVLYNADKRSRECFNCKVKNRCDWDIGKKNIEMTV